MSVANGFPRLGCGIGLRTKHYGHVLEHWPAMDWFEIISENFMVRGGKPSWVLERIRERYPVVMHGVSLSIGSTDPLNLDYLRELRRLTARVEPAWVSDHLCWTGVGGGNAHDLLPLPYTEEAIAHVVDRVRRVQDFLGRPIVLENVSSYLTYAASAVPEWEFLSEIARRADCYVLLDVNNVYVSSFNHGFDALEYLNGVPVERVVQFHLAGHTDNGNHLLDTHDHDVPDPVWRLYGEAVRRFGPLSTLIERDDRIPEFAATAAEAERARSMQKAIDDLARRDAADLLRADPGA
ncbi:MAG: MNIO family bufferin maturase [Candidatus Binatia bacterium]